MSEKLCVFCKHFNWDRIESRMGGYCETCEHPTLEGGASCKRGHFTRVADMGDMHSFLLQAETCKDYERP